MKTTTFKKITMAFAFAITAVMLTFTGCKKDKTGGGTDDGLVPVDKTEIISSLDQIIEELETLMNETIYGSDPGQVPASSKTILESAIASIQKIRDDVESGAVEPAAALVTSARQTADKAISDFNASKISEPVPGELFVNGLAENNDERGYIDFGRHAEYSDFGESGKQAFTVDLWLKLNEPSGFGAVVSVFNENGGANTRKGWFINHFGGNRLRVGIGFEGYGLLEPGVDFPESYMKRWYHFAFTFDETVPAGEPKIRVYLNGSEVEAQGADYANLYLPNDELTHMAAFVQCGGDGNFTSDWKLAGSIKHFHVWKGAKTEDEIVEIMEDPSTVTGAEPDLVCGWAFDMIPGDGSNEIVDLTGKFTATLCGTYEWIPVK